MKRNISDRISLYIMVILVTMFTLACLIPLLICLLGSLSDETLVAMNGFKIIPDRLSLETYQYIFNLRSEMIFNAYGVSIVVLILGTLIALMVTTGYAYATSVRNFKGANILSFIAYFTMLFNGGMLPWYIMCTKYYNLRDNIFALVLPYAMNVFFMYLLRNYFKSIPVELAESAKIDGAGQFTIFIKIMLPLAKVGMVTVTLFYALVFWNDWFLALMFINKDNLYPIQYLLYKMMSNITFLATNTIASSKIDTSIVKIPLLTSRMAMSCLSIGPIIFAYPFAQKYFVKGITLGAIKG
jgi:putative aldouronate transport system permease protein